MNPGAESTSAPVFLFRRSMKIILRAVGLQGATADDVSAVIIETSPVTARAENRHQWHQNEVTRNLLPRASSLEPYDTIKRQTAIQAGSAKVHAT
jgi:hypothetical protein